MKILVCCAAALLALAGCAASTNGSSPISVGDAYLTDLGTGHYAEACQLLTDELRARLGDCPSRLKRAVDAVPVANRDELWKADVRKVSYQPGNTAQALPQDIRVDVYPSAKATGKATAKPRRTTVTSLAARAVTNDHGLKFVKVGKVWRISDCGLA